MFAALSSPQRSHSLCGHQKALARILGICPFRNSWFVIEGPCEVPFWMYQFDAGLKSGRFISFVVYASRSVYIHWYISYILLDVPGCVPAVVLHMCVCVCSGYASSAPHLFVWRALSIVAHVETETWDWAQQDPASSPVVLFVVVPTHSWTITVLD
jgi:hypothetical protein